MIKTINTVHCLNDFHYVVHLYNDVIIINQKLNSVIYCKNDDEINK